MRISLRTASGFLLATLLCFTGVAAHAQFRASIQGAVTDSSGASIPGATVTLKDDATNAIKTATSNAEGVYNFGQLAPDKYTLTASATGFKQKVLQNVAIIPEQANSINLQLEIGETSTTVTVSADTVSAVDTETPNIGATITANEIQHMPSFNRDVFNLMQLTPGTIDDGAQGGGGGVVQIPGNQGNNGTTAGGAAPTENKPQAVSNGQQNANNGISIDGISTVSAVWGGSTVITPSEESIDNVRIISNDYDAEDGRFAGAQTFVTSKSGTNQFHGSAFFAIHRPGLNALQPAVRNSSGTTIGARVKDTARFNQWGGSLGGPIIKDRLFAFFAYETSPNRSTATSTGWYETSSLAGEAPANSIASTYLKYPGSTPSGTIVTSGETCALIGLQEGVTCATIPGKGLDVGSPLKTPLGTQDLTATGTSTNPGVGSGLDGVADIAFYLTSTPSSSTYQQFNGRLDAQVSQKDHLAFAIYWVPQTSNFYNGGARAYNLFHHNQINDAFSGIWNHVFGPTWLNEARANAAGWRWNELTSNPSQPIGLPSAGVTLVSGFGTNIGSDLNQWTYGYKDVATKVAGPHTIKFGGDYTSLHYLSYSVGRPSYSFYNIWDFLNDAPKQESGSFNSITGLSTNNRSDERENLFGAFIQDNWKVKPSLTLTMGVRYSYFGALYAKQDNIPRPIFGQGTALLTGLSIATGHNLWESPKDDLGPEFGFNWAPWTFNNKLIIRGGYGLNFNQDEIAITASLSNNPPVANNVNYSFTSPTNPGINGKNIIYGISTNPTSVSGYAANPHAITSYNANGLPTAGNAGVTIIGDGYGNVPSTYVQHFSLETDYEFSRQLVASIGYQGSLGKHLINQTNPNAVAVVQGDALNPLITGGSFWQNNGMSNNNAMLVEVKHPFVHHFSADAQFQWAKSMDDNGSGPYSEDAYYPENPAYSYGPSDFNVGKQVKVFGLWQPVIFHGDSWENKILGEWSLSGIYQFHTGFPWSPSYGPGAALYCQSCGFSSVRPYYLHNGGNDHSNDAFINGTNFAGITTGQVRQAKTINGSPNIFPSITNKYFNVPDLTNALTWNGATGFPNPNKALPGVPGMFRNAFVGPSYHGFDASITKGFGLPNNRILGETARLEIRADIFNVFNLLNLAPGPHNDISQGNFGVDTNALGGRTISFQGRFSF